ncbi:MAG: sulfite exporter TauE/SafE family protein [Thiohalocapsa sp. PB-PSB1]|jgi:hypothetical protein|nr:MAG: sulfite exporter TauE/SafE family protein [Thiohalocapsa sp. PB-PSB1]HCS88632.1 hypothetical protein [Chromatiaceae bacterium]
MPTPSAKVFRQQILRPAEGIFLFHARAVERLIEEQLGVAARGVPIPDLPYYLMSRDDFLEGLETENAEALSVIEGLRLPNYVILLPSPSSPIVDERSFVRARLDYWSRSFEAEVARAWQNARDAQGDLHRFGAAALHALIGTHAFAEVRDVLHRDDIALSVWDDDLVTRSFAAMVVRLRYFSPGARGFFFPAIDVWPELDSWLEASGLDLPEPCRQNRMPPLLLKSRPGSGALPTSPPPLPTGLPFGRSDPDLPRVRADAARAWSTQHATMYAEDTAAKSVSRSRFPKREVPASLEQLYQDALQRGSRIRRSKGWLRRIRDDLVGGAQRLVARFIMLPGFDDLGLAPVPGWVRHGRSLGLLLFEHAIGCAQRAEFEGRFAAALRHLGDARWLAQRLSQPVGRAPATVEDAIAEREAAAELHLASLLAAKWKLTPDTRVGLEELIHQLAAEDRRRGGLPPARMLLSNLEQVLSEARNDYYQLHFGRWLISLGRQRLVQPLPFQMLLKALRGIDTARTRLDEMPWSIADLERFGEILDRLQAQVTRRLEEQILPCLGQAMREADFLPRNHRERVAAHKMKLELLDIIEQRRNLKFTDVRDIVARNILRLPDPTLAEFFRGDRLARFDHTAARALPGVYQRGEIYIKGLQQASAPLFGTPLGRIISRYLLVPFGGAYLVLKSLDLLLAMLPGFNQALELATFTDVLLLGGLISLVMHTGIGRYLALVLWHGTVSVLRFVFFDGLNRLLRWRPMAELLSTGLVRALGRNLVQPLLIGVLPLIPIVLLAVFVEEVPIEPGLWLGMLAFALGTLARNTPAGRRFLDNLSTRIGVYLRRINQTLVIGLIQWLLTFFKEITRGFSQLLHRVDEALVHHLGERFESTLFKALVTPVWRLAEELIQFYVTVLVEPQVNPVKHFPIVSIGHKLLLPFLPAITTAFIDISASVLPKVVAYPLVTLTIVLLPGLFGFLVWELKENWKLYQANHHERIAAAKQEAEALPVPDGSVAPPVEPAVVGHHGERVRALMARGFHAGALPKSFDRLRRILNREMREHEPNPRRLLQVQRQLNELEHVFHVFFEREFAYALRERCRDPRCTLQWIETGTPRIATNLVELSVTLYPELQTNADATASASHRLIIRVPEPWQTATVTLCIRLFLRNTHICVETEINGHVERIDADCWSLIAADLELFAGRAGADLEALHLGLPAAPAHQGTPYSIAQ